MREIRRELKTEISPTGKCLQSIGFDHEGLICLNPLPKFNKIITHLKLCLATAIHNIKCVKNTHILCKTKHFTNPSDLTIKKRWKKR